MGAQILLRFLRIQVTWDIEETEDANTARGQKPSFTEDLNAPVPIEGWSTTGPAYREQNSRPPVRGPELILKPSGLSNYGLHRRCGPLGAAASSAATRTSMSSISMAFAAWLKMASAARTLTDAGVPGSIT